MLYKRGLLDVGDLLENGSLQREYERRAGIIPWPRISPAVISKKRELQRACMCHVFTFRVAVFFGHTTDFSFGLYAVQYIAIIFLIV